MTIWQHHKAIFDYVMIEAGCSDNPGVLIKGVQISGGPPYIHITRKYTTLWSKPDQVHAQTWNSYMHLTLVTWS